MQRIFSYVIGTQESKPSCFSTHEIKLTGKHTVHLAIAQERVYFSVYVSFNLFGISVMVRKQKENHSSSYVGSIARIHSLAQNETREELITSLLPDNLYVTNVHPLQEEISPI